MGNVTSPASPVPRQRGPGGWDIPPDSQTGAGVAEHGSVWRGREASKHPARDGREGGLGYFGPLFEAAEGMHLILEMVVGDLFNSNFLLGY